MKRLLLAFVLTLGFLIIFFTVGARGDDASLALPSAQERAAERNPRVLFIISRECERCATELARLQRAGGDFEALKAHGWTIGPGPQNHVQIVDRSTIAELVERLGVSEFPTVVCVDRGQIVRSFKDGCTTPLDAWTFGFLAKGLDERPPATISEQAKVETTGRWPLPRESLEHRRRLEPRRGERTLAHLRGPVHGPQIRTSWQIESWSHEELRSLHDYLHEIEMGGVSASSARAQPPSNPFSATRKIAGR